MIASPVIRSPSFSSQSISRRLKYFAPHHDQQEYSDELANALDLSTVATVQGGDAGRRRCRRGCCPTRCTRGVLADMINPHRDDDDDDDDKAMRAPHARQSLLPTLWSGFLLAVFALLTFLDAAAGWPNPLDRGRLLHRGQLANAACWTVPLGLAIFHVGNVGARLRLALAHPRRYGYYPLVVVGAAPSFAAISGAFHGDVSFDKAGADGGWPMAFKVAIAALGAVLLALLAWHVRLALRVSRAYAALYAGQLAGIALLLAACDRGLAAREHAPPVVLAGCAGDLAKGSGPCFGGDPDPAMAKQGWGPAAFSFSFDFHMHHYIIAGLLACFARFPRDHASAFGQAVCVGIFVQGMQAYGPDPLFLDRVTISANETVWQMP